MEITLYVNDAEVGPLSLEQVQAMLANGELTMEDFAFFEGCADWVPVADIPGINDAPAEEEEPAAEAAPAAEAQEATIYIWPEDAEDWAGPYTLAQVQEQLANEEIAAESFAAFDGSAEGATVADIPGVYDAPAAAEEAAEEEPEEEAAPTPSKKGFGAKKSKGGFAAKGGKGGLKKAGGGGLKKAGGGGLKTAGGAAKKSGAAKSAAKKGKAKGTATVPLNIEPGEISDKSFGKVMILGFFFGIFGVHHFITGKLVTGILKALIGVPILILNIMLIGTLVSAITAATTGEGSAVETMLENGGKLYLIANILGLIAGIWQLVDFLMLALGKFKDKTGRPVAMQPQEDMSEKKLGTIMILFMFLGCFGIHRFVAGKILTGILFFISIIFGVGIIWWFIDFIFMATGKFTDKEGRPILLTVS